MSNKRSHAELHHWWPECVSAHWKDDSGNVTRLTPELKITSAPPKNFGGIRNGHFMQFGVEPGSNTPWDENFEIIFSEADASFPCMIQFLQSLPASRKNCEMPLEKRFSIHSSSEAMLQDMTRCAISLAIRSPMSRNAMIAPAERFRGEKIHGREREMLIAANMRHRYAEYCESMLASARCVVLIPEKGEFIFGDGFYHNVIYPDVPECVRILVPITPSFCVLAFTEPSPRSAPTLQSIELSTDEVLALNNTVQIYSENEIFYRRLAPTVLNAFREGRHFSYEVFSDPIASLIQSVPRGLDV